MNPATLQHTVAENQEPQIPHYVQKSHDQLPSSLTRRRGRIFSSAYDAIHQPNIHRFLQLELLMHSLCLFAGQGALRAHACP
jgi:hypothetical protein